MMLDTVYVSLNRLVRVSMVDMLWNPESKGFESRGNIT